MGLTRIGLDRKTSFVRAKSLDQVPRAKTFRTDVSALLRRLWVLSCLKAEAATDEKGERESGPIAASRPASHREALGPPVEHKQDISIRQATLWPDGSRQSKTIL